MPKKSKVQTRKEGKQREPGETAVKMYLSNTKDFVPNNSKLMRIKHLGCQSVVRHTIRKNLVFQTAYITPNDEFVSLCLSLCVGATTTTLLALMNPLLATFYLRIGNRPAKFVLKAVYNVCMAVSTIMFWRGGTQQCVSLVFNNDTTLSGKHDHKSQKSQTFQSDTQTFGPRSTLSNNCYHPWLTQLPARKFSKREVE